jgi:hypothetical protein
MLRRGARDRRGDRWGVDALLRGDRRALDAMLRRGDRRGVDGLRVLIEELTKRLRSARVVARALEPEQIKAGNGMSNLSEIGARITQKKASHDAIAEEWAKRLDALDKREPEAFAVGDAVLKEREADLAQMESDLRSLSNLALAGSGGSASGSGA